MFRAALAAILCSFNVFAFNLISFDGKPTRWGNTTINYVVDSRGSQDFKDGCDSAGPCESERTAIQKAFQGWTAVPGVNLNFNELAPQAFPSTGYDGKNTITFVNQNWGGLSFKPPAGALAVTITTYRLSDAKIVDADIHFNGQYFNWGVVNTQEEKISANVVDIQNVAAHEVGHFLGLGHSSENYSESDVNLYMATMFFASGPGETFRRVLRNDDMAAIQHLYPQGHVEKPEVDNVYPAEVDARTTSNALLEISGDGFTDSTTVLVARKGDAGDVVGKIVAKTDSGLQVAIDTYGLSSGSYDIIVANSPDAQDRVAGAFALTSNWTSEDSVGSENYSTSSAGGCSIGSSGSSGLGTYLLMIALPLILSFPGKLRGVTLRIRKNPKHPTKRF